MSYFSFLCCVELILLSICEAILSIEIFMSYNLELVCRKLKLLLLQRRQRRAATFFARLLTDKRTASLIHILKNSSVVAVCLPASHQGLDSVAVLMGIDHCLYDCFISSIHYANVVFRILTATFLKVES